VRIRNLFVPEMPVALRLLWERVRPGGKLAITTSGPRFLEPATTAFWNSIREERPDLYKGFNPWDLICDSKSLSALFSEAEIALLHVEAESNIHAVSSPNAWWAAVLGSGYRGTVDQLDEAARNEFARPTSNTFEIQELPPSRRTWSMR
jgi:hypothetical protein